MVSTATLPVAGIPAILTRTGRGGGFIIELAGILGVESGIVCGRDGSAGRSLIAAGEGASFAGPFVSSSLLLVAMVG